MSIDTITSGAGDDVVDLTEGTAAADDVLVSASTDGDDSVTGFGAVDGYYLVQTTR